MVVVDNRVISCALTSDHLLRHLSFFNRKGIYSKVSQKYLLENGLGADSTDNEKMMCLIVKLAINEFSDYEGL